MRCVVECDCFEYCNNKEDAIRIAKNYLDKHPEINSVTVDYHPDTKKSIDCIGKDNGIGAIWFIVGRKNVDNIINFVRI